MLEQARLQHDYIKYLNQIYDQRASYVVLANSVFVAGIFSTLETLTRQPQPVVIYAMVASCVLTFITSVVMAVWAFLPKTFDADSPLHSSAIAKGSMTDHENWLLSETEHRAVISMARENWVVSCIVEHRSLFVGRSARLFFVGVLMTLATFLITLILGNPPTPLS